MLQIYAVALPNLGGAHNHLHQRITGRPLATRRADHPGFLRRRVWPVSTPAGMFTSSTRPSAMVMRRRAPATASSKSISNTVSHIAATLRPRVPAAGHRQTCRVKCPRTTSPCRSALWGPNPPGNPPGNQRHLLSGQIRVDFLHHQFRRDHICRAFPCRRRIS